MAFCDVCGNFDKSHAEEVANLSSKNYNPNTKESYQPKLYYYWDAPIEEDYNWRDAFPNVDCMCEICFDIANKENKIKWLEVSK